MNTHMGRRDVMGVSFQRIARLLAVSCIVAVTAGLVACEPGTVDDDPDGARLSLAGPSEVHMSPGEAVELAWLLVRQSSGPEPGQTLVFTIISPSDDHGCALSLDSSVTDTNGLGGATFTAGDHSLAVPLQVMAEVTSIPLSEQTPPPVSFTIYVEDAQRILREEPAGRDRYEGVTGGNVQLAVRASTSGNRPLTGETISWEITSGGAGGASFTAANSVTDARGVAFGELRCGSVPSTMTVQATLEGTAPVVFTINVSEWGSCTGAGDCPPGWECRDGSCIEPTPDCTDDEECGEGMRCRFGECVTAATGDGCKTDAECDPGETCVAGICTGCEETGCPCETVDDCPEGFICEAGECVCDGPDCGGDPPGCEIDDPDLVGLWDVDSTLHLREGLPSWLDGLLDALGPVFRYLSDGMIDGFDFDIPIIGDALEDAADSLIERYVPPWVGELMRAIADINDILSTMGLTMEMNLWDAGVVDQYNGTLEWQEVEFTWRGDAVRGRLVDITGFDAYAAEAIDAEAICGTFYIHRHDVAVAFGTIVRWLLDVIVTIVSDGEYYTLEELLLDLTYYCADLADAVDELAWDLADGLDITLPDIYSIVEGACIAGIEAGTAMAIDALEDIMITTDAMTLAGNATITDANHLDDGRWLGTLFGNDFSGEFTAEQ